MIGATDKLLYHGQTSVGKLGTNVRQNKRDYDWGRTSPHINLFFLFVDNSL